MFLLARARRDPVLFAVAATLLLWAGLVLRTAWVADDAYVSLRMVDNLIAGRGLTWNPGERVLAGTNPLWMLLLTPPIWLSGDEYLPTVILGSLCMAGALALLLRLSSGMSVALLVLLTLTLSRAFVDFSTSGLENPLSCLLFAAFAVVLQREERPAKLAWMGLITAFALINRMDNALIFAPGLGLSLWRQRSARSLAAGLAGGAPFALWLLFSLFYFGFAFPNTAYAKLNTGMESVLYARQGIFYYWWVICHDPLTLLAILGLGALAVTRAPRTWPLVAGAALYMLYILRIGGDFMGGRFFVAPLFATALAAAQAPAPARRWLLAVAVLGAPFALPAAFTTAQGNDVLAAEGTSKADLYVEHGVADERLWYAPTRSLWSDDLLRGSTATPLEAGARPEVVARGTVGYSAFRGGDTVHVVDVCALGDPLLARLPAATYRPLRVGHYYRVLPRGYVETVATGQDHFEDRQLADYYARLRWVVSGPLWDRDRLAEIWRFNTGANEDLINRAAYSAPPTLDFTLSDLRAALKAGPVQMWPTGLLIDLKREHTEDTLVVELSGDLAFEVELLRDGAKVGLIRVPAEGAEAGLVTRNLALPERAARGYDALKITPSRLDNAQDHALGALSLEGEHRGEQASRDRDKPKKRREGRAGRASPG